MTTDTGADHVISSDGTPIAVWHGGSGPPLLLVHGTTADHTRWAKVVPTLARRFTTYAIDRRGRGGSGDAPHYSVEQEGRDVAAVADWIGTPVHLLGHSYGAICCLEAAFHEANLRTLILYEPPIPLGTQIVPRELRAQLDALVDADEREAALLLFFRGVVGVPEPQLDAMRAHPAWPSRIAAAHTMTREIRLDDSYRLDVARLRGISLPALLLLGADSPAIFHEATRMLATSLPRARTHVMPGQQHVAMDLVPDDFVEIVSTFLQSNL